MNNLIIESLNSYANVEIAKLLLIFVIVTGVGTYYAYNSLKDKKYIWINVIGSVTSILLFLIATTIAANFLETVTNGYQQVGLYISFLIAQVSLYSYTLEAIRESRNKRPDPDHVNRKHFRSTLNNTLILLVLGLSFGFFTPILLGQILFVASISSALTLVVIHAVALNLFKDTAK